MKGCKLESVLDVLEHIVVNSNLFHDDDKTKALGLIAEARGDDEPKGDSSAETE